MKGLVDAIGRMQAMIEFDLDGTIVDANDVFLRTLGYRLEEVVGRHHRIFCSPEFAASDAYLAMWKRLASGQAEAGTYLRVGKNGRAVWLQASYNPILDRLGQPVRIVKFATDVTEARLQAADIEGKISAVDRVQAVIEFDLKGRILSANQNFLSAFGYSSDEVVGQHHRLFCDPAFARSSDYIAFWERLGRGEFNAGEFRRVAKDGADVWIQASYNPIFDAEGRPFKVVKFATDITDARRRATEAHGKIEAIGRSQAVIEFDLEGNILSANSNFLRTLGYTEAEVVGRHHSMFCDPDMVKSKAYRDFWANLGEGQFQTGRYRRIGKHAAEVWIQATYNPIMDISGQTVQGRQIRDGPERPGSARTRRDAEGERDFRSHGRAVGFHPEHRAKLATLERPGGTDPAGSQRRQPSAGALA